MAAQSYTQLRTRLDTNLADSEDKTFSSGEKDEFMNRAFNNAQVSTINRDTSLTSSSSVNAYAVPSGTQEITDIFIDDLGDGVGSAIARNTYDVIDGYIYFRNIPLVDGKTIILFYKKKLTTSDSVPDSLQEYVLLLAELEAFGFMKNKYSTRFLKNDVSMGELISSMGELQQRTESIRKNLTNRRVVEG